MSFDDNHPKGKLCIFVMYVILTDRRLPDDFDHEGCSNPIPLADLSKESIEIIQAISQSPRTSPKVLHIGRPSVMFTILWEGQPKAWDSGQKHTRPLNSQ